MNLEEVDRELILKSLSAVVVFLFFLAAGFTLAEFQDREQRYVESFNITVDEEKSTATVKFRNNSFDMMLGGGEKATFFIDEDRDGSFDYRLRDLTRDGVIRSKVVPYSFNRTGYDLHFTYRDNNSVEGDSFLRLELIEEIK